VTVVRTVLPSGVTVRHASTKRFHICVETSSGAHRITSRDTELAAANAFYALRRKHPNTRAWVIDQQTGQVVRPMTDGAA